jgi:hypothetical protein
LSVSLSLLRSVDEYLSSGEGGRSPFSPDNEHLHNRFFRQASSYIDNSVVANSLTGLLISGATSGVAVLGFLKVWWPTEGNGCLFCLLLKRCFTLRFIGLLVWRGRKLAVNL